MPDGVIALLPAEDEASRVRQAARTTSPEALALLALDPAVTVRAAVALNPVLAQQANGQLVRDPDERVRMLLAGKVARLLPGLTGAGHETALAHVHGLLAHLAQDTALRVRVALTDALNAMPEAPHDVILHLAHDKEGAVSNPILQLSPLLTDADLLELLSTPPHPGVAAMVAGRAGLSAVVADGIAAHADSAAVCTLLANPSASIQEATLDALAGRAGDHPEWHEPLVRRAFLPAGALAALSRLVVGQLLDTLMARPDIPHAFAEELRTRLEQGMVDPTPAGEAELLEALRQSHLAGDLDEARLTEAAAAGDHSLVAAILSVASGVEASVIQRAVTLRSAKGLVSLTKRAGFGMEAAVLIQTVLGGLAPGEILRPTDFGDFPLGLEEMDWQIELLHEPGL